jgi:hypothetical protein
MPNFYLREAVSLLLKTTPILWVRIGSYALLWLGLLVYFAVIGGVAWLLSQLWSVLGVIVVIAAFAGAFGIVRWITRYYFYLLKAAHAAVMTEFIVHGEGPDGSQIQHGKEQVQSRFKDTSVMFAIDQVLDGVVKAFNRTFTNVTDFLPLPGMDTLQQFVRRVSRFATTYIDEAILTRAYAQDEQNVWAVAKDGVILYAQAWKPILANAVALTLLSYVEFLVFLVILGVPAVAIGALVPALKLALGIAVLLGAWMLKLAVADAYSLAATLLAYHRSTEGMEPDPEWQARLEQASDEFQELKQKAAEKVAEYQSTVSGEAASSDAGSTDGTGTKTDEPSAPETTDPEATDQETRGSR